MLILILSLILISFSTNPSTTISIAYSLNDSNLGVYIDVYEKAIVYQGQNKYNIEVYRYQYPDLDRIKIIKPLIINDPQALIEELKTNLTEQICLEKLPKSSIPADFNDLMNRKYASLSLNNVTLALVMFYVYDTLTYLHPFNQEIKCIEKKSVDLIITSDRFIERYIVKLDPFSKEINVKIEPIGYSSFLAQSASESLIKYSSYPSIAPKLVVTIESIFPTDNIPILAELIKSVDKELINFYSYFLFYTNKSYLSLALVLGVVYIIILFILDLINYISNVINYTLQRAPAPFKRALGYHDNEIYSDLVKGIIAGVIALGLEFFQVTQNIKFRQITFSLFIDMFKLDITFYLVVFGFVYFMKNLYKFIIDNIKGLLGGDEFYRAYSDIINKDSIKDKLEQLRNKIKDFRQELSKGLIEGIDISKYIEFVNGIPLDSLANDIKSANNITQLYEILQKIKSYNNKLDEYLTEYKNLYKDAEINYAFWKEHVKNQIRMFGGVNLSSLTMIPAAWRAWFARKFTEENPEYIVTENMIKKLDIPKSEVLKIKLRSMFEDNYGEVVILFSDGEFLYAGKNKTYTKALMAKILAEDKDLDIAGKTYRLISFSKYGVRVLIFGKIDIMKDFMIKYNI